MARSVHRFFTELRRRSRRRRYMRIQELLGIEFFQGFILDLGGGPASFFSAFFPAPDQIVLIDLEGDEVVRAKEKEPQITAILADGTRLPLADGSMDAIVCNSVIEHVADPQTLAVEIRRVGRSYFVQTPNGRFPLETHSFVPIPFYNLVSATWLRRLACKLFGGDWQYISRVHYLSEHTLKRLFPEAALAYESVLGMHKSFYLYHSLSDARP